LVGPAVCPKIGITPTKLTRIANDVKVPTNILE